MAWQHSFLSPAPLLQQLLGQRPLGVQGDGDHLKFQALSACHSIEVRPYQGTSNCLALTCSPDWAEPPGLLPLWPGSDLSWNFPLVRFCLLLFRLFSISSNIGRSVPILVKISSPWTWLSFSWNFYSAPFWLFVWVALNSTRCVCILRKTTTQAEILREQQRGAERHKRRFGLGEVRLGANISGSWLGANIGFNSSGSWPLNEVDFIWSQ